jgi:CheY-like chemotaxis protein
MNGDEGSGDIRTADDSFLILLVEDNNAHATLIMRTFERLGFSGKIDWVKDGKAALDYLHEHEIVDDEAALPKLVMLDLRLPKLDGHEVLREMKRSERLRIIPVVVLTTSTSDYDLKKAYSNHVNSYLTKPLSFDDLQKTVEEIKNYWFEWNHYPKPA